MLAPLRRALSPCLISLYRLCTVWHTRRMNTATPANPYKNHRFPAEIISHAVWLYFRFCLSYRDVEELLFARGVLVTYAAIRNSPRQNCRYICGWLSRPYPRANLLPLAAHRVANMATTPLTSVGNSADSRGLAQCRDTVYGTA
jgi:hypothetical protein